MDAQPGQDRRFLLLQGPHGPFFDQLSRALRDAGAHAWRVCFNAGDMAFTADRRAAIPFRGAPDEWPAQFDRLVAALGITDLALYGDTRPIHAAAVARAHGRGLRVHVFEEGYLRPFWITYERGGSNGNSRVTRTTIDEMRAALRPGWPAPPSAPARWGDLRAHVFYGAAYHFHVLARNGGFPGYRPHRALPVSREFRLYLARLLLMPAHAAERFVATRAVLRGGFPYHLALLQLEHDASFLAHSPFATLRDFAGTVIAGFARGAPRHHHLVFKAHPLDDGRAPIRRDIRRLAREAGVADRVHFLRGGKLAHLLDHASSVVTVNSTAAEQALWRGLPVRAFGQAVYGKPELVSDQPLPAFFAAPRRPDADAYACYRRYLLETSQIPGGYYSARGRRQALRRVVDAMLRRADPYEALARPTAAAGQHLRRVS